jgi:hypothetical protein
MKTYVIFGRYYGSQAEAKAAAKANDVKFDPETDTVEVPTDKDGLIAYLNRLAARIDQMVEDTVDEFATVVERQDPPVERIPAPKIETSIALDEAFAATSLGHQLTLAGIALENAFQRIGRENQPAKAAQGYKGAETVAKAQAVLEEIAAEDDELFG